MLISAATASLDWAVLVEFAALGVGTGIGAALGLRFATESPPPAPTLPERSHDPERTLRAVASLVVVSVGFALVGFLGGAILGALLLAALAATHVPGGVVALALTDLVTGLAAGTITGGLVATVGGRFQLVGVGVHSPMLRSLVVAGTAGAIAGFLAGGLSGLPALGLLLSTVGVGVVSAAAGILISARHA
jgi:hypothetical protein